MYVMQEKNGKIYTLPAGEIKYKGAPLAEKILVLLAKRPSYPKEIAQTLREEEQKIYYHVRQLEKQGLISIVRKEERGGAVAKFYALSKPAFVVRFAELKETKKIPTSNFSPFIEDGKMNARIIVGSPDPHGPERARSRDAYYAIDLGLFLGTFLIDAKSAVNLDTDIRGDELRDNLIVIGGPVINKVTKLVNDKMPIRFDSKKNIFSTKTKKTFKSDDCALIVKMKNPFDERKSILVIAGKRYSGTRAAILAIMKNFPLINSKNSVVVRGFDRDYDGVIDDVEILEVR